MMREETGLCQARLLSSYGRSVVEMSACVAAAAAAAAVPLRPVVRHPETPKLNFVLHTELHSCHRIRPVPLLRLRRKCDVAANSVSADDDLLLPYARGHGPAHSHRHVRDCQPVVHGNATHESWPPPGDRSGPSPAAQSTVFVTDVPGSSRIVYGHMTVVRDPLGTVSVLEPGGPGGCAMRQRASVEETAGAAECLFAQNAGFFNTDTGRCLGNVVSDGRTVQDSGGMQNAQFGIRRDGTLVFGYLSEDDVSDRSNPFVQLVSGVVWLLRNGQVYINQSLEAECDKTQETGYLRHFVDVLSARVAVGHDAEGNLVLFHIDGQTGVRGMSLWEVAEFLKKYGVINAINLDGGGSSTFVMDGSLASYPSDHCIPDGRWRCARRVSTVLCVHRRRCRPPDCSGHGECVDGSCRCGRGWQGAACDTLVCRPPACGPHGVCTAGFYGDGCNQTCGCANDGSCDPVRGRCACTPGFHGNTCEEGFHTGFCLANQIITSWRREEDALRDQPHLTDLLLHLPRFCRGPAAAAARFHERQDYSYVPLTDINGATSRAQADGRKREFVPDDSDSQDEVWSPS
ncbi:hypothetical protein F2P81_016567 [Scophthalmus maximus]|uniref:EGF-like domain-containing protein n=1 Tax=Scophthalmus maximus TaxID=52904 RepID=A0A6A4SNV9_SCOMX|nr:hypothetical protein F2P81_016567 [Scophthalmus maximus]